MFIFSRMFSLHNKFINNKCNFQIEQHQIRAQHKMAFFNMSVLTTTRCCVSINQSLRKKYCILSKCSYNIITVSENEYKHRTILNGCYTYSITRISRKRSKRNKPNKSKLFAATIFDKMSVRISSNRMLINATIIVS